MIKHPVPHRPTLATPPRSRARRTIGPDACGAAAMVAVLLAGCAEARSAEPPASGSAAASTTASLAPARTEDEVLVPARGPTRIVAPRPEASRARACSRRRPVCVHPAAGGDVAATARALAVAERTLDGVAALRLPAPRPDFASGGGPELDVYLDAALDAADAIVDLAHVDRTWDLAAAFVRSPPPVGSGCAGDARLARAVAETVVLGRDAGVERALGAAAAAHLASLIAPCAIEEIEAVDAFQRIPESGLTTDDAGATGGGRLFFAFLEERWGSGRPGELTTALVAAAPQRTPPSSAWFRNEPDLVDILTANARAGGSPPFGEMLRDFAVARAFVGSRSDDAHLLDVARFGDPGRVRFDWTVPWKSLPRRLAPARPVQPTGASYVWIDLADAPGGVPLTLVAEWEPPVSFRWAIVKIGPEGDERGRLEPPTQLGATTIQQSLVDLHGLAGLIVVGVNEGGSSAVDPHDPDDGPYLGQGYTLTLYPQ